MPLDNMKKIIKGSCLCGEVTFELCEDFSRFFFCHCEQCKKLSGTAHAANLFTSPKNISWLSGQDSVSRYEHPERNFFNAFCSKCGSRVPMFHKNGQVLVVPAGCLDTEFLKSVDAHIFVAEQANWHKDNADTPRVMRFENQTIPKT